MNMDIAFFYAQKRFKSTVNIKVRSIKFYFQKVHSLKLIIIINYDIFLLVEETQRKRDVMN